MRRFCASCGTEEKPLFENFCQDCYYKEFNPFDKNTTQEEIPYCLECYSLKLKTGWSQPNSWDDVKSQAAYDCMNLVKVPEDGDIWIENISDINLEAHYPVFDVEYGMSINAINNFNEFVDYHLLNITLTSATCKTCIRKKTGSKETIVQLRAEKRSLSPPEDKWARAIAQELNSQSSKNNPNSYLAAIQDVHGGLDFHFGDILIADEFISRLRNKWIGHYERNFRLVTQDKEGQRVYEITHLYRLPPMKYGDYVTVDRIYGKVLGITKAGVKIKDLRSNQLTRIKDWKLIQLPKVVPIKVTKLVVSETDNEDSYLIMDLQDYSNEEILKKNYPINLPIGEEIEFLKWDDDYFIDN